MKGSLLLVMLLVATSACTTALWDQNLVIRGSAGVELSSNGCPTSDGGMLYVWSDAHSIDRDIYAQRVNSAGETVWPAPRLVVSKPFVQKVPIVTATSDGCYVVAWEDLSLQREAEICIQKIDANCATLWQEGGIYVTDDEARNSGIRLVADDIGGVIVTWTSEYESTLYSYGQSYAANGARRWQDGGIDLTGIELYTICDIVSDGENGIIYSYSSEYVYQSYVYVNRLNGSGTPVWGAPVCIGDGTDTNRDGKLAMAQNAFYVFWICSGESNVYKYVAKYSNAGDTLWQNPVILPESGANGGTVEDIVYSPVDDCLLISAIRAAEQSELVLNKMNSNGQFLWEDGVIVEYFSPYYYSTNPSDILPDGAGGCMIVWAGYAADYGCADIRSQRYNSFGVPMWQTGGILLSSSGTYYSHPRARISGNYIWTVWTGRNGDNNGIRYQRISLNGAMLHGTNGRLLFEGLESMYTEGNISVSRGQDMLVIWEDDRAPSQMSRLYCQAVNPDGSVLFAPNGIPVTADTNHPQYLLNAGMVLDGYTVVVWQETRTDHSDIYAQLLGHWGERLWGETGMKVATCTEGWNTQALVSYTNADIFVLWTHTVWTYPSSFSTIMMQKISGGEVQWGETGLELLGDAGENSNVLSDYQSGYLVYNKRITSSGNIRDLYVVRIDETNGSPMPGWGSVGKTVGEMGDYSLWSRDYKNMKVFPDGIFVLFKEMSTWPGHSVMAQRFGLSGEPMLTPYASPVIDPGASCTVYSTDCGANDIYLLCSYYQDDRTSTVVHRVSYDLQPLWPPLQVQDHSENNYLVGLSRFADDTAVLAWVNTLYNPDYYAPEIIQYMYVLPDGTLAGDNPVHNINTYGLYTYTTQMLMMDNRVMLTWRDGSSSWFWKDEPIEHAHFWAQAIGNDTTPIDSPEHDAVPVVKLYPNFPNPFNPSTDIRFELKAAGRAKLSIYNLKGQMVRRLADGMMNTGIHTVQWDGLDDSGNGVATGVYMYRLEAAGKVICRKMLLMK